MKIRISTEGVERAADELAACGKKLRYISARLEEDINDLKSAEQPEAVDEEVLRLRKQQQILESDIKRIDMTAGVLRRVTEEIDAAEDSILDHEAYAGADGKPAGVNDLDRVSDMIEEAVKQA